MVERLFGDALPQDKTARAARIREALEVVDQVEGRYWRLLRTMSRLGKPPTLRRIGATKEPEHDWEQYEMAKLIAYYVLVKLGPLGLPTDPKADAREAAELRRWAAAAAFVSELKGDGRIAVFARHLLNKLLADDARALAELAGTLTTDSPLNEQLAQTQYAVRQLLLHIIEEQQQLSFERGLGSLLDEFEETPRSVGIIEEAMRLVGVDPRTRRIDPAAAAHVIPEIIPFLELADSSLAAREGVGGESQTTRMAEYIGVLETTLHTFFERWFPSTGEASGSPSSEHRAVELLEKARDALKGQAQTNPELSSSELAETLARYDRLYEEGVAALSQEDPDGPSQTPLERGRKIAATWFTDDGDADDGNEDDTKQAEADPPDEGTAKATIVGPSGTEVLGNPPSTPLSDRRDNCEPDADPYTTFSTSCLPRIGGIGLTNPGADNNPEVLTNPGAPRLEPGSGCSVWPSPRPLDPIGAADVRGAMAAASRMDLCRLPPGAERTHNRAADRTGDAGALRPVLGSSTSSVPGLLPQVWNVPAVPLAPALNLSTSEPSTMPALPTPGPDLGSEIDAPSPGPPERGSPSRDADKEQRAAEIADREARQDAERSARDQAQQDQLQKYDAERQLLLDKTMADHEAAVLEGQRYTEERDRKEAERLAAEQAAAEAERLRLAAEEQPDHAPRAPAPVPATPPGPAPYRPAEWSGTDETQGNGYAPLPLDDGPPAQSSGIGETGPVEEAQNSGGGGYLVPCADWQDGMEGACDVNAPSANPAPGVATRHDDLAGGEQPAEAGAPENLV